MDDGGDAIQYAHVLEINFKVHAVCLSKFNLRALCTGVFAQRTWKWAFSITWMLKYKTQHGFVSIDVWHAQNDGVWLYEWLENLLVKNYL